MREHRGRRRVRDRRRACRDRRGPPEGGGWAPKTFVRPPGVRDPRGAVQRVREDLAGNPQGPPTPPSAQPSGAPAPHHRRSRHPGPRRRRDRAAHERGRHDAARRRGLVREGNRPRHRGPRARPRTPDNEDGSSSDRDREGRQPPRSRRTATARSPSSPCRRPLSRPPAGPSSTPSRSRAASASTRPRSAPPSQSVLLDPKGWQKVDGVRFVNVTPPQAAKGAHVDVRVTLASPGLTDKLCAPMRTLSQVSCWNGERSVLNFRRWALGDDSYGSDVARYRDLPGEPRGRSRPRPPAPHLPRQGQARPRDGAADPRPRWLQGVALPVGRLSQRKQPHPTPACEEQQRVEVGMRRGRRPGADRPAGSASRSSSSSPRGDSARHHLTDGDRARRPARRSNASRTGAGPSPSRDRRSGPRGRRCPPRPPAPPVPPTRRGRCRGGRRRTREPVGSEGPHQLRPRGRSGHAHRPRSDGGGGCTAHGGGPGRRLVRSGRDPVCCGRGGARSDGRVPPAGRRRAVRATSVRAAQESDSPIEATTTVETGRSSAVRDPATLLGPTSARDGALAALWTAVTRPPVACGRDGVRRGRIPASRVRVG